MRTTHGGTTGIIDIPATIYPGMFEGEFQVNVKINGDDINLIVSTDSVEISEEPTIAGLEGKLLAEVIKKTEEGFLIHLPGEVQGASNRMEYVA